MTGQRLLRLGYRALLSDFR